MYRKLFLCAAASLFLVPGIFAQSGSTAKSMQAILNEARPKIVSVESDDERQIARIEFNEASVNVPRTSYRYLYSHKDYEIITFGDPNRVSVLNIILYSDSGNKNWQEIKRSYSYSREARVTFSPPANGYYKIDVTVGSFLSGYDEGYFGLLITHN